MQNTVPKAKPIRIQLNTLQRPHLDKIEAMLSAELQMFLNPNRDFEIVRYTPVPQILGPEFEKAMIESSYFAGVEALMRQAAAYALVGLRVDEQADASLQILYGHERSPPSSPEEHIFWDHPVAVVGVLAAHRRGMSVAQIRLYPSVYTAGYLGKDGLGPHQAEEMSGPVIKGVVQRWRMDYVRDHLEAKKRA